MNVVEIVGGERRERINREDTEEEHPSQKTLRASRGHREQRGKFVVFEACPTARHPR
jgi:hypothetical protein